MLVERKPCQTPPQATVPPRAFTRRIAPERKIRLIDTTHSTVSDELDQVRRAWARYQSTRKHDAVYGYLNAVFEIVQHWKKQHRAKASSHQALVATKQRRAIRTDDLFAVVIFCTSDSEIADARATSKWSQLQTPHFIWFQGH